MAPPEGTLTLSPADGSIGVRTYREGVARAVGHDLIIDVEGWEARVEVAAGGAVSAIELDADPRSLRVREGLGGAKPLTDGDRAEIEDSIDAKVLRGEPIAFRSELVEPADGRLSVRGDLTLGGATHAASFELELSSEGRIVATLPLTQSEWGIKPYRALMGALKVRDEVEVLIDVGLPAG